MNVLPLQHPEDVSKLPPGVQLDVVAALVKLGRDPELGKPLVPPKAWQKFQARLDGLRALKVPELDYWHEIRVVYRLTERGVEVIAIAPRLGSQCYRLAAKRLLPQESAPRRRRTHSRHDWTERTA